MNELLQFMIENNVSNIHKNIIKKGLELGAKDDSFLSYYKKFIKYKHLMKNKEIRLEDFFKEERLETKKDFESGIEFFGDKVENSILENKAKKLKHSVMSNKYSELEYEGLNDSFQVMVEENISRDIIQKYLTKKIAAIKSPYHFEELVNNFITENVSWSKEDVKNKLINTNATILADENNELLIRVPTHKDARKLGSRMWCITREQKYFDNYTSSLEEFCFYFNFNKTPHDNTSLQALITKKGKVEELYLKDDTLIESEHYMLEERFKSVLPVLSPLEIKERYMKFLNKEEVIIGYFKLLGGYPEELNTYYNSKDLANHIKKFDTDLYNELTKEEKEDYRKQNNKINNFNESINQATYKEIIENALFSKKMSSRSFKNALELTLASNEFDAILKKNNSTYNKKETLNELLSKDNLRTSILIILEAIKESEVISTEDIRDILKNKKNPLKFEEVYFLYKHDKTFFDEIRNTEDKELKNVFKRAKDPRTFLHMFYDHPELIETSLAMFKDLDIEDEAKKGFTKTILGFIGDIIPFNKKCKKLIDQEYLKEELRKEVKTTMYSAEFLTSLLASRDKALRSVAEVIIESDETSIMMKKINTYSLIEDDFKLLRENKKFKEKILNDSKDKNIGIEDFTDYERILTIFTNEEALIFNKNVKSYLTESINLENKIESDHNLFYMPNSDLEVIINKIDEYDKAIKKEIKQKSLKNK